MENLIALINDKKLSEQEVVNLINQFSDKNCVVVDYEKTLEENLNRVVKAADWQINEKNCPIPSELAGKKTKIFTKLFIPDLGKNSDFTIKKMKDCGYRTATIMELASLYGCLSKYQKQFHIFAFKSEFTDKLGNCGVVPYIGDEEAKISRCSYPDVKHDRILGILEE